MSTTTFSPKTIWTTYDLYEKTKVTPSSLAKELQFNIPGWKLVTENKQNFWRKIIWLLVIVSCFWICAYQVSDRVALYASEPISTRTIIRKNNSVKFPTFTVCPNIHRMLSMVKFEKRSAEEKESLRKCTATLEGLLKIHNVSLFDVIHQFNVKKIMQNIIFHQPRYSKTKYDMVIDNLVSPFGICKKITFPKLIPFQPVNYILNIQSITEYSSCKPLDQPLYTVYMRPDGVEMKSNPIPEITAEDDTEILYAITAREFKFLNRVEFPCTDIEKVQQCHNDCLEKRANTLNLSICRLPGEFEPNLPNCSSTDNYVTMFLAYLIVPQLINYEIDCGCPKLCEEIIYTLVYKSKRKKSGADIRVYFDDNIIDTVTEYYSYTVIQLLCDVGGNLGLFLGLCIPAMLQILENAFVYIRQKLRTDSI